MRSRYAAGEGAQRDFQTAGLNGVFGYFCRRGQKYPAPGRGISLWTIPPSTLRVATSASLRYAQPSVRTGPPHRGRRGRACGRGDADFHASDVGHWLGMTPLRGVGRTGSSAPTEERKGCERVMGGAMWASPPTDGFKKCGVWADRVVRPYGHIHRRCSPSYAEGDFLARKAK